MNVVLANTTANVVQILGSGGITISSIISGTGKNLVLTGTGTGNLTLSAANTYSGNTTISARTLILFGSGSIASSPLITIASGAGFNVSGTTSGTTLATNSQNLTASANGTNTTGTITVAASKNCTLGGGSSRLTFSAYGSNTTAPLTVAGTGGSLDLNSTNVTVTTTTPLPAGTYKLIAKSGSASVTGTNGTLTVNGSGLAASTTGSLAVTSGELLLTVAAASPAISTSGTPAALSSTYGSASSNTTFTVSGSNMSEGVLVTPPSGFEVSTDGTSYSSTVTVGASGTIASTTVYLRLAATATAGAKSGNIVLSSSGATGVDVATTSSTVTTRTLTITANAESKTYGNAVSSGSGKTGFTSSGLQNSETIGSVTLTYAGGYNATDSAGTYTITPSAATGGTFTASNYALTYANGTLTVTAIVPGAPTITGVIPGDQSLSVAFTAPASNGGSAVTNYEYSTNGGTNWTTRSPVATTSPLSITGLTNGTPYNVQIRAVNTAGSGTATASTSGTPAAPSGTLSTSGTISAFTATYPAASTEQSFSVNGTGLTGSLTVTAPSGFEISLTSGSGFGSTATISANGTLASTPVYVRLAASSNAASYSGNVTISGGSATTQNVAASGTVSKATPTVSVAPTASAITYGQTLASSILSSGTASVNGTFAFTTPATSPSVGTASQGVTFTPADSTNYNTASTSADVTVNKATPTVSVAPTASGITYGQTLASSTLSGGTASVAGTFAFTTSATAPAVGTASQGVTFTPTDGSNYNTASTTASVTVGKATPTLVFNSANSTTINGTVTLNATSASTGAVTYTSSNNAVVSIASGVATGVAVGTATIAASQAADSNYNAATANQTMTVTAAPVVLATYEFAALAGNETTASSNSTNANLSSSAISRGAGLTASANAQRYNATNWAVTSIANAVSGDNYMEFTITPNSGYQFSVSSILVQWQRTATGNTQIALRSSVDNYASDLDTVKSVTDSTSTQTFTWTLAQSASASPATYRFYSYAEATSGGGGPGDGTGDDIVVTGTITQLPPTVYDATINGTVGTPLSANITATHSPTGYEISSGTLPAGLSLNATSGQISGTPTVAGNGTIVAVTATNGGGTSAAANLTFNIAAILPSIGSPAVSSIATTSATLGATVTANGGATLSARGTTWGTSASPTGNSLSEGNSTVSAFTHNRTDLTANTLYYYRGYATNSIGTAYTADGNFTTLPLPPTVGTGSAVSASGFTANWSHLTMGAASYTYTLDFSTDNTFATGVTTVASISSASANQALTALSASTTYYYRVKAVNAQGSSDWSATSAGVSTPAALGAITSSGTLSAFTATYPAASAEQSFSVSGTDLTGSLTVTAPAGFEVSLTSGSAFGSTATISASGTLASTTVYVRLPASATPGSYSGNVAVSGGDAATQTVAASGMVSQASQTITFSALSTKNATDAAFALTATASSNLTISYASSNTSVATVAGDTVTLVGGGSTTITASQAGNTNYAAATSVTQTLTVTKVAQTISGVTSTLSKTYGDAAYSLGATVGSELTITYTSSNTSVATIAANGTVTIVAPGTTTLTASQAGDASYSAAADATQSLTVGKATPTLVFNSSNSTTVNATVTLNATSAAIGAVASTGAVTYTSSNNAVVSITSGVATGVAIGTATITASQAADSNYNAVTANQTMTVTATPSVFASQDFETIPATPTLTYTGANGTVVTGNSTGSDKPTSAPFYAGGANGYKGNGTSNCTVTFQSIDTSNYSNVSFSMRLASFSVGSVGNGADASDKVTVEISPDNGVTYYTRVVVIGNSNARWSFTSGTGNATNIYAANSSSSNFTAGAGDATTTGYSTISISSLPSAQQLKIRVTLLNDNANESWVIDDAKLLGIINAPTVTAATINGTVGTALSANITATNSPTSYAISSGTLPSGLSLNGTTGLISGTSTAAGNGTVVAVTATNAGGTSAAANLTFNIAKGTPTVSVAPIASAITYGQTLASSVLSGGTASVAGTYAFTTPATAPSVGTASQPVTFTPTDSANYNTASTTTSVTVNKATPTVSAAPTASGITYGQTLASSVLSGGTASVAGTYAFTTPSTAPSTAPSAGTASQPVTFTPTDTASYNTANTTASVTVSQATPTISVAPTASNITIGQTLANSTLSGGTASVAGAFAFTTPATAPALGISSQDVTFTPTDSTNYTAQTTNANVGVVCLAPALSKATVPTSGGFTVNWAAVTGAANYTVVHSASKNMTGATSVNTASTTLALTGLSEGLRFVQVRANNAAGASANSTTQVNQLQSVAAGATKYVSLASAPSAQTVAGIFGSANESGLAAGATDSTATAILLLNSDGSTANTIFYDTDVNEWREGPTDMGSTAIAVGKAFMLKNNTGSTDYFLLVGTPREGGSQPAVSLSSAGNFTLLTTGRTSNTTLTDLNLNPGTGAGQFKAAAKPSSADRLIVPPANSTDPVTTYWYHTGSGQWYDGLTAVPSASIPAGQGFFIKRATDSTFSTWTMPAE